MTALATGVIAVVAAMLSPFASNFPDGLEYVSEKLSFTNFSGMNISALFHDYQVSLITDQGLSTLCAGLMGVAIVFIISQITAKSVKFAQGRKNSL